MEQNATPETQDDAALKVRAGDLLRTRNFDAAFEIYQKLLPRHPEDRGVHLATAALLHHYKRPWDGHGLMCDFFLRHPLGAMSKHCPDGPLALAIRGQQAAMPLIVRGDEDDYRPMLRGGHFTLRYLLDKRDVARRTYTIVPIPDRDMPGLPDHALMINTIAEPDVEGNSLQVLARHLQANPDTAIINHPDRVWATARDRNYQRLQGIEGVTFPRTIRVTLDNTGADDLQRLITHHRFDLPVILRFAGGQTGRGTHLIDGPEALARATQIPLSGDHFLIAYRPLLWRGEYFRKLRLFCIDGQFYPVVCHLDRTWNVHGGNRREIMLTDETLMAEEKRFLSDWRAYVGPANVDRLTRIADETALEFFGIDFTLDDEGDGGIFIYELNAAMRHSFGHAKNFPYKQPYDEAISAAFRDMVLSRLHPVAAGGGHA